MNSDIFFCLILVLLMGTAALYFGLKFLLRRLACSRWNETTGTVVSTDIKTSSSRRGKAYRVLIQYEYSSEQGETLQGNRYSFRLGLDIFERQAAADAFREQYAKDTPVTVWYDPQNPKESVLSPGLGDSYILWLLLVGFGLLMYYASALMILRGLHIITPAQALALMGMGI